KLASVLMFRHIVLTPVIVAPRSSAIYRRTVRPLSGHRRLISNDFGDWGVEPDEDTRACVVRFYKVESPHALLATAACSAASCRTRRDPRRSRERIPRAPRAERPPGIRSLDVVANPRIRSRAGPPHLVARQQRIRLVEQFNESWRTANGTLDRGSPVCAAAPAHAPHLHGAVRPHARFGRWRHGGDRRHRAAPSRESVAVPARQPARHVLGPGLVA